MFPGLWHLFCRVIESMKWDHATKASNIALQKELVLIVLPFSWVRPELAYMIDTVSCLSNFPSFLLLVRLFCPWDFPGMNTGVGCHFLLQGIFPTQGSNPALPHFRQILYHLSHWGSPSFFLDSGQLLLKKPTFPSLPVVYECHLTCSVQCDINGSHLLCW